MHDLILRLFDYLNTVILLYFIAATGVYTLLMLVSLYHVTLHAKFAGHHGLEEIADSPVAPPVALIVPAYNEEKGIVATVQSVLGLRYPEKEIIVVDDGSTDGTLQALIEHFELLPISMVYREVLKAQPPVAFYRSRKIPELLVISKENGGKSDALNLGLNLARSPYFCSVDADTILERDALLRLMAPIFHSSLNTVVSGGIVRIVNGCRIEGGKVVEISLPYSWLERCQIVEYTRTFLFGRPAWSWLGGTFIASGAFCMLHRESVVAAGGYSTDTVTEDIDVIAALHRSLRQRKWKYRMVFTTDPVCWTEAPTKLEVLAKQRRRWQLGLMQTVVKHDRMIFNPRYGVTGMITMPFHAYIEALGCLIEATGTILVPFSFIVGAMPFSLFLMIMFLAVGYGTLLSIGSVLMEETTLRRYPKVGDVLTLILYAVIENFGYRQLVTFFRAQGVLQYFRGKEKWEVVAKTGVATTSAEAGA